MANIGRFVWFELLTEDVAMAARFYGVVGGYTARPAPGMPDYTMFGLGEKTTGGMMKIPDEAKKMGVPPHWEGYVAVPDVDVAAEKAKSLGGNVLVGPMDIPNVGRFALIQDPQGGTLNAFKGSNPGPDLGEPTVGDVGWAELATTDLAGALDFYRQVFHLEKLDAMDMGPAGQYVLVGPKGGRQVGGIWKKPPEMPVVAWLYYFRVANLEKAMEAIQANGGKIVNGPMDVPGNDRIAQGFDNQGAFFAVVAAKA